MRKEPITAKKRLDNDEARIEVMQRAPPTADSPESSPSASPMSTPSASPPSSRMLSKERVVVILLMGLFVLQNSSAAVLGRYIRTSTDDQFEIAHLLVVVELLKLAMSVLLESQILSSWSIKSPFQPLQTLAQSLEQHIWQRPWDALKLALPASLYFGQNLLQFQALGTVQVHFYQVTIHSKVVLLAVFSSLFLGRSYSCVQWMAVLGLAFGVSLVTLFGTNSNNSSPSVSTEATGMGLLWMANLCSATAAIYFEKVIKKTEAEQGYTPPSLWMRNIQLSLCSLPFCFLSKYVQPASSSTASPNLIAPTSFFHGFTFWVYVQAFLYGAGGLLVAAVVRSTSTVHKSFAAGASVVLSTVCSVILFSTVLTPIFILGTLIILVSIVAFAQGCGLGGGSSPLSCSAGCWEPLIGLWVIPPSQKDGNRAIYDKEAQFCWMKSKGRSWIRQVALTSACLFVLLNMLQPMWGVWSPDPLLLQQRVVVGDLTRTSSILSPYDTTTNDLHQVPIIQHYSATDDISSRSLRFPSIEQRIQLYMTDWYTACSSKIFYSFATEEEDEEGIFFSHQHRPDSPLWQQHQNHTLGTSQRQMDLFRISPDAERDIPFVLAQHMEEDGAYQTNFVCKEEQFKNCKSIAQDFGFAAFHSQSFFIKQSKDRKSWLRFLDPPVLVQYGDFSKENQTMKGPKFAKTRHALTREEIQEHGSRGLLCNPDPHTEEERSILSKPVIWKMQPALYLGSPLMETRKVDIAWDEKVNKAIWNGAKDNSRADGRILNNKDVPMTLETMLKHKFIIILEVKGVSSGLMWALYSKSCVFMQTPTSSSWVMEELLEPWVHYVPLDHDLNNTEDMVAWALRNDDKAQQIGGRGSLWMQDLFFHPEASEDENSIKLEILRRYKTHFQKAATN